MTKTFAGFAGNSTGLIEKSQ